MSGLPTVVEVEWDANKQLACINLVQGVEVDLIEALPQVKALADADSGGEKRRRLIAIQRPPRQRDLDTMIGSGGEHCSAGHAAELIRAGIAHYMANRPKEALACFERAAKLNDDNVVAHFGAAQMAVLTRGDVKLVRTHYDRIRALEPLLREYVELLLVTLGFAYGRPEEAAAATSAFLASQRSLQYQRRAAGSLQAWARREGSLHDALSGQEKLIDSMVRTKLLDAELSSPYILALEYAQLGLLREANHDFEGALEAYKKGAGASDSKRFSFDPDLGRLRLQRRLHGVDQDQIKDCNGWKRRIETPSFKTSLRKEGGLALAKAQIAISCGEEKRGMAALESLIKRLPGWNEPLEAVRDYLISQGRWGEAQEVERTARRVKSKSDMDVLRRIFQDVEGARPQ